MSVHSFLCFLLFVVMAVSVGGDGVVAIAVSVVAAAGVVMSETVLPLLLLLVIATAVMLAVDQ